jgi:hypothetical protein
MEKEIASRQAVSPELEGGAEPATPHPKGGVGARSVHFKCIKGKLEKRGKSGQEAPDPRRYQQTRSGC